MTTLKRILTFMPRSRSWVQFFWFQGVAWLLFVMLFSMPVNTEMQAALATGAVVLVVDGVFDFLHLRKKRGTPTTT